MQLGVYFFSDRSVDHFGTFARSMYTCKLPTEWHTQLCTLGLLYLNLSRGMLAVFILAALQEWAAEYDLPTFDPITTKIDWSVMIFLLSYVVVSCQVWLVV